MNRRSFLGRGFAVVLEAAGIKAGALASRDAAAASSAPSFATRDRDWQAAYDQALQILHENVQVLPRFDGPLLIEGAEYAGIWQECGPLEALVYRRFRPDVARNSHLVFFALQREDGQLPANHKRTDTGFGQIQMVVPIAATAWELARSTGDEELLATAYKGCGRWDTWLLKYRNTRATGLIEGFCTYDTGMDNSPRWAGMPNQCPKKDAKNCPQASGLPRLCPDLSATVYGGRAALSAMARALGKVSEADHWAESADQIRRLILSKLYVPEDGAFYDLDANGQFVKVRTCAVARVCGEHVVDQQQFDNLWTRQLHNPKAFWAPYPLPSVAMDDPLFVRPIPRNSWGGASQALTALRAGRWFDFYGRSAEFSTLMDQWCKAIARDMTFRQQIDPETGAFTEGGSPNYSPAALVMLDFTWRLAGIHEEENEIHWNVRPGHCAADHARFALRTHHGADAEMQYDATGARLQYRGKTVARIEGGTARLVTNRDGRPLHLRGISERTEHVTCRIASGSHRLTLRPNESVALPKA
jgi:hypothetical protein